MPSVEIAEDVQNLLDDLEKRTGKPKTVFVREAVLAYADEFRGALIPGQTTSATPTSRTLAASLERGDGGHDRNDRSCALADDDPRRDSIFGFLMGKGRIVGDPMDLVNPIVPECDWDYDEDVLIDSRR
jgi:hypothetical protein